MRDQSLLIADGALCDVCVLDVDIAKWQAVIDGLRRGPWPFALQSADRGRIDLMAARDIFSIREIDEYFSPTLTVEVDSIRLDCFFFQEDEIEFSFEPPENSREGDLDGILRFMQWLADVCGMPTILTMETSDHRSAHVLARALPG